MKNCNILCAALRANMFLRNMRPGEVVERVFGVFQADRKQLYRVLSAKVLWSQRYTDPLIMLFHLCDSEQRSCIEQWLEEYIPTKLL